MNMKLFGFDVNNHHHHNNMELPLVSNHDDDLTSLYTISIKANNTNTTITRAMTSKELGNNNHITLGTREQQDIHLHKVIPSSSHVYTHIYLILFIRGRSS